MYMLHSYATLGLYSGLVSVSMSSWWKDVRVDPRIEYYGHIKLGHRILYRDHMGIEAAI